VAPVSVSTVALDPVLSKRLAAVVRKLQDMEEERDQLILQAREQGASLREIAQQAGMSHVGIKKLIGRHLHPRILKAMDEELPDEPDGGDADE
jgi:DNA-directed RNA polymerase specialized sigma24 family protein